MLKKWNSRREKVYTRNFCLQLLDLMFFFSNSVVLETVRLVIKSAGGLWAAEITNVLQAATEVRTGEESLEWWNIVSFCQVLLAMWCLINSLHCCMGAFCGSSVFESAGSNLRTHTVATWVVTCWFGLILSSENALVSFPAV